MKNNNKTVYECAECRGGARKLHEIIYGHGNRKICEEYNIQVPLCEICHGAAHDKWTPHGNSPLYRFRKADINSKKITLDVKRIARHLCESYLKLNYWDILIGVKQREYRHSLELVKDQCKKIIESSVICKD